MYHFTEDADDDSDGSEKSLNGVMNDYSQQGYYEHLPPPPGHDSVLVSETPIDVYRQSQQIEDHGQDSVLVQETPPEFLRQHVYLSDDDVPVCDLWICDDTANADGDAQVSSKRRKVSHYTR